MAAIAKLLTLCAGAAAGAGACVATGVLPAPALSGDPAEKPAIVRPTQENSQAAEATVEYDPAPTPAEVNKEPARHEQKPVAEQVKSEPEPAEASAGAVEYEPPPTPVEAPSSTESTGAASSSGSAAGEFGP